MICLKMGQVTVTEHILGGYRKGAKSNSPYTSFTNNKMWLEIDVVSSDFWKNRAIN